MPAQDNERYTAADCAETGSNIPVAGKVIVADPHILPDDLNSQLFFCFSERLKFHGSEQKWLLTASLENGRGCSIARDAVIGVLKPELLPDDARLQLSQLRPLTALKPKGAPTYTGYCFLPDGRYSAGIFFENPKDAVDYVQMQASYQHRILLCDQEDYGVVEMVDGKLTYPTREEMDAFRQGGAEQEQTGGMTMT